MEQDSTNSAAAAKVETPCCGRCRHFCNDPAKLESVFRGMTAMSSGYASVKDHDGLCDLHGVYLSYRDRCPDFAAAGQGG